MFTRKWDTHEGDEEENDVHDGERKAGLEHGACLVQVDWERITWRHSQVSERSKVQVDIVVAAATKACTAGIGDSA